MVSSEYLLNGALYALKQCGLLLRTAVNHYNQKDYANAIVLAAFAREEFGRSRILRDLRKQVVGQGKILTAEEIRKACRDHIAKQEWAQVSVVQRASGDDTLGKLLRKYQQLSPPSEEWQHVRQQIDELTERKKRRTPQDRHDERLKSLYVEPDAAGTGWNKPWEADQETARIFVEDAANDYAVEHDRFVRGIFEHTDPELFAALQKLPEQPDLPKPQRPRTDP